MTRHGPARPADGRILLQRHLVGVPAAAHLAAHWLLAAGAGRWPVAGWLLCGGMVEVGGQLVRKELAVGEGRGGGSRPP